jgi:hypothetical protein
MAFALYVFSVGILYVTNLCSRPPRRPGRLVGEVVAGRKISWQPAPFV